MRLLLHRLHSPGTRVFSTIVLIIGSIISKVFGIVREFSMAAIFGTSFETDSWLMASIVPNLLYGLVGNTITNVVVPVLSGHLDVAEEDSGAQVYMDEAFTWSMVVAFTMVVVGELLSAELIHWVAPGFHDLRYRLSVTMVRIMLPAMPFMALGSLINGILQSKRIFTPSTVTPIIINVGRLIGIIVLGLWLHIIGVAIGFLAAQMLQLVYLIPTLAAQRLRLHFRFSASHPWTRQSARLALPFLASHGANVGGIVVDRIFASTLKVGRIAALNFSNVLSGLPLTLLINPVIAPLYTQLSQTFNNHDEAGFRRSLQDGFELVTLLIVPLTLAFVLLRVPIVRILYQHGHFNSFSTRTTAHLLLFWSIGLPAQALGTFFARGLVAQRVTRTMASVSILAIAVNIVGDFLLIHPLGSAGLALATSVAAWFRTLGMGIWLFTHGENPFSARPRFILAELSASGLFILILFSGSALFGLRRLPFGFALVIATAVTIGLAISVYWGVLKAAGVMPTLRRRSMLSSN